MFNTTNINLKTNTPSIVFNAPCTGILQRSNPNSIFIRFGKGSRMENTIFASDGRNPYMHEYEYRDVNYKEYASTGGRVEVIVLQILVFGDNQFLVEVIEPKFLNT